MASKCLTVVFSYCFFSSRLVQQFTENSPRQLHSTLRENQEWVSFYFILFCILPCQSCSAGLQKLSCFPERRHVSQYSQDMHYFYQYLFCEIFNVVCLKLNRSYSYIIFYENNLFTPFLYETLQACASVSVSKLCNLHLPYLVNFVKN